MGRSQKALKNVSTGLVNKFLIMALAFATRTIFIRLLGAEYTGISSLYTNILSVLSLAEMGIGNVLMFYLYSSLRDKNEDRIYRLVQEFKYIYYGIIAIILAIGIGLVPFLHFIVSSPLDSREVILYYLLYLFNSVASYSFVYRIMVISADQQSYIQNRCNTITTLLMYVLQIGYLLLQRDFLGFLVIQLLCTIGNNVILNYIACKKYPFLIRKRVVSKADNEIDKKELKKNIKATFLFKLSDKILDQTDNIIISIMFGTIFVGYYSNYYLIINYLVNFASIIVSGLLAGYGNLYAEGDTQKVYKMFRVAMLIFSLFGTFCTVCYACIIQDFIPVWVGPEYLMDYGFVLSVLFVFYLRMVTNTVWMYRSAMGLFKEVQYINLIAAGLNILLSVVLGKICGMKGVIIATAIARIFTSFWYEGKVIFQKFEKSPKIYYFQQLKDLLVTIVVIVLAYSICALIDSENAADIIVKLIICISITSIIELIAYCRTEEFLILKDKIILVIHR